MTAKNWLHTILIPIMMIMTAKNWLRLPCLLYGAHVATTLVPILDAFGT